jgi:hypothetical protein
MTNYGEQVEGYPAQVQIQGQYTLMAFIVFLLTLEKIVVYTGRMLVSLKQL